MLVEDGPFVMFMYIFQPSKYEKLIFSGIILIVAAVKAKNYIKS